MADVRARSDRSTAANVVATVDITDVDIAGVDVGQVDVADLIEMAGSGIAAANIAAANIAGTNIAAASVSAASRSPASRSPARVAQDGVADPSAAELGTPADHGVVADVEAISQSTESRVVARSIITRSGRGRGLHLDRLERLARDRAPLASESAPAGDAAPGPPSPPPAEEFLRLFNEYERYVASIGSRILGANNGVDDLVQEVFLVIYQEFHKLRELSSIKAWLATIATRVAWRQRGRPWLYSKLSLTQVEELNPLESTDASPELQADLAALLDRLRSMPATLREPWLLRFIDGETLPRIAELCDCSQSTVQRRLREAGEVMLGEKAPGSSAS